MATTRNTSQRLDEHDAQFLKVQSDLDSLKTQMESLSTMLQTGQADSKSEIAALHDTLLKWMKQPERSPVHEGPSGSGSGLFSPPPTRSPKVSGVSVPPPLTPSSLTPPPPPPMGEDFVPPPSSTLPWAAKKIKLPEFFGFDPQGWIQKALLFFEINNIDDSLRIRLAQLSMSGVATHWFTILHQIHHPLTWEIFQSELLRRFSGLDIHNPYEQLATMQHTDSIYDYIDDFEYLLSLVPPLPESQSMGYFIAGLQDEVQKWVRLHRPKTRLDAMMLAKDIEHLLRPTIHPPSHTRFRYQQGFSGGFMGGGRSASPISPRPSGLSRSDMTRPNSLSNSGSSGLHKMDSTRPLGFPRPNTAHSTEFATLFNRNKGVRSLSKADWEDRRKRGLCFKCGQQYGPTHKCPEAKLRVLLLGDDDPEDDIGLITAMEESIEEPGTIDVPIPEGTCMAIEYFGTSIGDKSGGKSLKFEALIGDLPVIVMVDSGASHNFISRKLLKVMGISAEIFPGINIRLGDGHLVFITQRCSQLPLKVASCDFQVNALVFDMGHLDLVLGMEWLKSLGDVIHNWQQATMKFVYQGKPVGIQGLTQSSTIPASLQSCLSISNRNLWIRGEFGFTSLTDSSTLSVDQRQQLQLICDEFEVVFREPTGLPPSRSHDHSIVLQAPETPICVRPYRYPHAQKAEIKRQIHELLKLGMIRPSTSSFSSPVILVRKKDNSWRMCVDYRALNKATIPDKFPIPVVDELIDELNGAKFFSKLDLKSGYNQIRMAPSSIDKTAFRTHDGHYEFLVMPFGLTNAPATFQAVMNDIFRPFLRKSVVVFFDDILIYSPTWSQHLVDVQQALRILLQHQFVVNQKKCSFGQTSIEYLGHIINGDGVAMDPKKITAVLEWPIPKTIKGLRGFLGLTGYYRKFIRHYGSIARPLTDLTKKDAFGWNQEAQTAFDALKEAMVTAPLLALPDFSRPFVVECDASGRGIGAVLMQHHKPLAYFSKSLSDRNLAKSAYEREIMALVLAVQHWRPYLLGTKFIVCTDQKSLKFLLHQRISTPDQQNWVAKLLGYDFEIQYKPGRENRAADALSRRADDGIFSDDGNFHHLVSTPVWVQGALLLDEIQRDADLQAKKSACESDPSGHPDYLVRHGVLYYHNRLVIPRNSRFIPELIREFHQSASGGHSGYYRTYRRLAANLYWPGMISAVQQFVRSCDICQRCKASSSAPGGLLQPLPIPNAIWEDISMDFIVGLPKSKGYDAILVVVDRLSKYGHFILLKHPYTARSIAEIFVREVVRHHGIPKSIVSDRDPLFLSSFWREIFRSQGTQLNMSSAYHPETDGQTEVINRCLESYLRCFAVDQPRTWAMWIPWAEFWYNTTFHVSTGKSPFEVVYGRKPPSILQFVPGEIRVQAVLQELLDRDEAIRQLKIHLGQAQSTMKTNADKKRRDVNFQVGEWVYVKLKPYRQMSVVRRIHHKLAAKFFGPFKILDKVGSVAYKLELPPTSKIHPVFHVSLLKKAVNAPSSPVLPPELEITTSDTMIPAAIIANRTVSEQGDSKIQWLVQWQDQPIEEAT